KAIADLKDKVTRRNMGCSNWKRNQLIEAGFITSGGIGRNSTGYKLTPQGEAVLQAAFGEPAPAMSAAARLTAQTPEKPKKGRGRTPKWTDLDGFIQKLIDDPAFVGDNAEILKRYRKARGGVLGTAGYLAPTLKDIRD